MAFLPVAERELRVAARKSFNHRLRFAAVGLAVILVSWITFSLGPHVTSAQRGSTIFSTLATFAMIYCWFAGALLTADSLSEEKREGTLGLLFLTDLRGYDIVLGKLVARSLGGLYALVAILPVMALPLLLGGVTPLAFVLTAVSLVNLFFFSLATGIFVSSFTENDRKGMFLTVFALLGAGYLPFLLEFFIEIDGPRIISPLFAVEAAIIDGPKAPIHGLFPVSVLVVLGFSYLMLAVSSRHVPNSWQEQPILQRPRKAPTSLKGTRPTRSFGDANPFTALLRTDTQKPKLVLVFVTSMAVIWFLGFLGFRAHMFDTIVMFVWLFAYHFVIKLWLISECTSRLVEDRRSGALELLLTTPVSLSTVLQGYWKYVIRLFSVPLIFALVAEGLLIGWLALSRGNSGTEGSLPIFVATFIMLFADFVVIFWEGISTALTARSVNRAVSSIIMKVMFLPWIIFIALIVPVMATRLEGNTFPLAAAALWLLVSLTVNAVLLPRAMLRVTTRFQELVSEPMVKGAKS